MAPFGTFHTKVNISASCSVFTTLKKSPVVKILAFAALSLFSKKSTGVCFQRTARPYLFLPSISNMSRSYSKSGKSVGLISVTVYR